MTKHRFLRASEVSSSTMATRWSSINVALPFLALVQGVLVLSGGEGRWFGTPLEAMMTFEPWAHLMVGYVLTAASLSLAWGLRADCAPVVWGAAWVCAGWYFTAMSSSIWQLLLTPDEVSNIGWVGWVLFGVLHVVQAQSRVGDRIEPVEEDSSAQNL